MSRSTYLEKEVIQEYISSAGSYDGTESGLSSNNVLDAIDEVKSLITLPTASQVSFTAVNGNLTETDTNVQSAVGTLDGAVKTLQTQVIGGVTYKGGYNANTNIPDLESPDTITIEVGDMYTITGNGDFYTEAVTIGDVLIAEVDSPTSIDGWTVVENNLEDAADVAFDNTDTGLAATNVQTALDEFVGVVTNSNTALDSRIFELEDARNAKEFISISFTNYNISETAAPNLYFTTTGNFQVNLPSNPNPEEIFTITNITTNRAIRVVGGSVDQWLGASTNSGRRAYLTVVWDGSKWIPGGPTSFNFIANNVNSGTNPPLVSGSNSLSVGGNSAARGFSAVSIGAGTNANGNNSISIGVNSSVNNTSSNSIVIGDNCSVLNSNYAIALGGDADVSSADRAVQIGSGLNTEAFTIQFLNNRIANAEGLYTSHVATNYSPSNSDNVTSHFEAIDVALGSVSSGGSSSAQDSTVNEETITTNKTLIPEDLIYQHILSNTASLGVALPSSPVNGTHFIIKNDDASSEDITVTGGPVAAVLLPGEVYEVVYGNTKWMVI